MFELLVPAEKAQLEKVHGDKKAYDVRASARADGRGDSCSYRTQGSSRTCGRSKDWIAARTARRSWQSARAGGRDTVGCIILGRGEDDAKVLEWLTTAASVPGFIGFAVGRTDFWHPLVAWRDNKISRETAVEQIARRYREFVDAFETARAGRA